MGFGFPLISVNPPSAKRQASARFFLHQFVCSLPQILHHDPPFFGKGGAARAPAAMLFSWKQLSQYFA
ncbi:hypothetical protein B4113_2613 [Geobacillus sp. B4113_201601]|nr:hypothetical protein B4113_2613 [Geobacillus sp. B4113_201601]